MHQVAIVEEDKEPEAIEEESSEGGGSEYFAANYLIAMQKQDDQLSAQSYEP